MEQVGLRPAQWCQKVDSVYAREAIPSPSPPPLSHTPRTSSSCPPGQGCTEARGELCCDMGGALIRAPPGVPEEAAPHEKLPVFQEKLPFPLHLTTAAAVPVTELKCQHLVLCLGAEKRAALRMNNVIVRPAACPP